MNQYFFHAIVWKSPLSCLLYSERLEKHPCALVRQKQGTKRLRRNRRLFCLEVDLEFQLGHPPYHRSFRTYSSQNRSLLTSLKQTGNQYFFSLVFCLFLFFLTRYYQNRKKVFLLVFPQQTLPRAEKASLSGKFALRRYCISSQV